VRRPHVNGLAGFGVCPPTQQAAAGKDERVCSVLIEHSDFEIQIERRRFDWLPHRVIFTPELSATDLICISSALTPPGRS
jgi:hypothetical protein